MIVNRLRADMVKRGDMMSSEDVVEILAVDLLGIVPDDENIVVHMPTSVSALWGKKYRLWICSRKMGSFQR